MEATENKFISLKNLGQYTTNLVGKMADDISTSLETANEYTDQEVSKKSSVQFCIWEEND